MTLKKAYFAGGCFWCMVKPFDSYPGINRVTSGYMGGYIENPTYEQVKQGQSGHLEVVEIMYQSEFFSYDQLLEIFFSQIDPTDNEGQFHDRGAQYRTAVFYTDDEQRITAEQYISQLQTQCEKNIVTEIRRAETFYRAEEYHQDYYKKQPENYAAEQQLRKQYKESLVD